MSGGAELQLNTDRVPGVENGTVSVQVRESVWNVRGSATFNKLGVQGTLTASWGETEGLTVGARIPIQQGRLPGIRGGFIEGRLNRTPERQLRYGATGELEPAIPGINSRVRVTWDNGLFDALATVDYRHGFLGGELRFGLTNRAISEEGAPAGDPDDTLRIYGGGSLDITLGEYVRGRAGVDLTPTGEMVVQGELGLANDLELFPRREVNRRIFGLDIDIPIAGIVVAGRGFGIFAFIGGSLDASAGFGPGVLRDTRATITYNPSRPDDTVLTGSAEFFVPANAGLRLAIRAGVGGSLAIADVRGGLEIGGALGVEGHARARVDLRWTPTTGLSIDALAEAIAQPVFRFDITGFVEVNVAIIGTVWEKRWQLADIDFGSSLQFGVRLPIHFQEGRPFSISMSDVELIVPDIDSRQLLEGLMGRVS